MNLLEYIRKRQSYSNMANILQECNIELLLENCQKTTSINIIETYFKNWPYNRNQNYYEVVEATNILEGFIHRSKSNSDKNKCITLFSEMVLPKVVNMKTTKDILESLDIDCNELIQECDKYIVCDRVLNNHNKLVKRGINKLIGESILVSEEGIDNFVTNVCNFIDKIEMPFPTRYNVALENTLYLLDRQNVQYDRKNILESITDYFFINLDKEKINTIYTILDESMIYTNAEKLYILNMKSYNESVYTDPDDDIDDLDVVLDSDDSEPTNESTKLIDGFKSLSKKTPELLKGVINKLYTKSSDQIVEELPNFLTWMRKFAIFSTLSIPVIGPYLAVIVFFADKAIETKLQKAETEKIIKSFKTEKEKAEKRISSCKNEEQEVKLKRYIRELDKSIDKLETYNDTLYTDREREEQYESNNESFEFEHNITLKEYRDNHHSDVVHELYSVRSKLHNILNSKHRKLYDNQCIILCDIQDIRKFENGNNDFIIKHMIDDKLCIEIASFLGLRCKDIDNNINHRELLDDICDILQSDMTENFCISYDGDEDLYTIYLSFNTAILLDDGTDELISEQVHNSVIKSFARVLTLEEQLSKIYENDVNSIFQYIDNNIENMDLNSISCIGKLSKIAPEIINPDKLLDKLEEVADNIRSTNNINKYIRLSKIQEGINSINTQSYINNNYISIYDTYKYNDVLQESIELLKQLTINETSFVNTMKIAQQRLKNNMKKLSDKDKELSRQLDYSVDSMVDKLQRSVTNNNREAVIKGSIIPSASKIIKIAIAAGATYAVNPAIAVIGILGGFAAAKQATEKERRYILDEIDIQLKVVEKKIQLADRADNMRAMEQLLKIEQKLKKEKSRIEYHKKDYVPVRKDD